MTLEQAVYEALSGHAPLADLVGTAIYPVEATQGAPLPRIVFARQETENIGHLGGRGTHDRVQISVLCYADDPAEARQVAAAARAAMEAGIGGAIAHCRLIGRVQARVREAEADPGAFGDALLFLILAAET